MSDPVTNVEIEDVLSSIRRLVSDEARQPVRAPEENNDNAEASSEAFETEEKKDAFAESAPAEQEMQATPALILTPSLRVQSDNNPSEVAQEDDAEETPAEDVLILSETHQDEDISKEAGEQTEEIHPEIALTDGIAEPDAPADMGDELPSDAIEADETAEEHRSEPEAQGNEASVDDQNAIAAALAAVVADDVLSEEEGQAAAPDTTDDATDEPRSIEDKIAALEALINRNDTAEFEPDGAEDGANAGRAGQALPWEDSHAPRGENVDYPDPDSASEAAQFDENVSAFRRAHEEAAQAAAAELQADAADTLLGAEDISAVLDEEALRDMVAEIVRQELQGPLGERITRNVRKLVRREIYRALAANELD